MKYNDYMELFTVSPEVKSSVFSKVKQHEKQVKEAGENSTVIIHETKKKNTLRMTPMRWIAIAMSIILVATATPLIYYFGFNNNTRFEAIKLEYMENLMVDVDGVTAYSIRQDTEESSAQTTAKKVGESSESKSAAISLLSSSLVAETADKKPLKGGKEKTQSYLYSTKESYESGNVEYNDTTKVTFMKNKEVTEDVYDNNGNLIDSTRKIAQEELDAQVNKIYTTKQFTFIQFVAKVESTGQYGYKTADGETGEELVFLRTDRRLTYDEYGVADFDKYGYFSSHLTSSFVIDNFTGYIYKIENIAIEEFENGLVWTWEEVIDYEDDFGFAAHQRKTYYSVSTDENHNLVFTNIVPNTDIEIRAAVMDAYGWVYVINNRLDEIDADRKIIYSTDIEKFAYDSDKYVYVMDGKSKISKRMVDGKEVDFESGGIIRDLQRPSSALYGSSLNLIGMYENLAIYKDDKEAAAADFERTVGLYFSTLSNYHWMDNNYDMLIAQKDDKLYYISVDLNDYRNKKTTLNVENDFTLLSSLPLTSVGYNLPVGNDLYRINEVYRYVGATETKYFHIVRTTTGVELVELTSKSYTHNVFIFQPINK